MPDDVAVSAGAQLTILLGETYKEGLTVLREAPDGATVRRVHRR